MPLEEITMTEGNFVTHTADEWYPGVLDRIEEADDYGFGATVRFVLILDDEDFETWALASQKMSPKSKLYGWVKGIDPQNLPELGKPWDYKALNGRRVEVMFEHSEDREKVVKIRAEKGEKKGQNVGIVAKQKAAAKAKAADYGPDEEPF